jgi:hypothetical protein
VTPAAATLGKMFSSAPSTCSTKRNRRTLPLWGDRIALPARDLPPLSTPMRCLTAGACWACWGCSSVCATRALAGGSARCGAPGASRWSLPLAAPGRPRGHCLAMPARYAPGRLVSVILPFFLCPLSLATVSDHLVKISEPSSRILLCAAAAWCKLGSVKCVCATACDELSTSQFLCQYTYWQKCYYELCSFARFS